MTLHLVETSNKTNIAKLGGILTYNDNILEPDGNRNLFSYQYLILVDNEPIKELSKIHPTENIFFISSNDMIKTITTSNMRIKTPGEYYKIIASNINYDNHNIHIETLNLIVNYYNQHNNTLPLVENYFQSHVNTIKLNIQFQKNEIIKEFNIQEKFNDLVKEILNKGIVSTGVELENGNLAVSFNGFSKSGTALLFIDNGNIYAKTRYNQINPIENWDDFLQLAFEWNKSYIDRGFGYDEKFLPYFLEKGWIKKIVETVVKYE